MRKEKWGKEAMPTSVVVGRGKERTREFKRARPKQFGVRAEHENELMTMTM